LPIDEKYIGILSASANRNIDLIGARFPTFIDSIIVEGRAEKAGLKKGDHVVGINGIETPFYNEFQDAFRNRLNDTLIIKVRRGNSTIEKQVVWDKEEKTLGAKWREPTEFHLKEETQHYTFGESWSVGWDKSVGFLSDQINAFGQMFSGKIKAKDSLGSFISIGKLFGPKWDGKRFWSLTAMLSILLGFINLLPIPALDGGHVMFLLWEVFTGKKPSDKFLEVATLCGFILLIIIMVYALGLDIVRHVF